MKRLISTAAGLAILIGFATVAAAPPLPPECTSTYGTPIEVTQGASSVQGTAGNDYIVVSSNRNSVSGLGGSDCIVVTGEANSIKAGNGADDILDSGTRNSLKGENGADYIKAGTGASVRGGAGIDTCVTDSDDSVRECEL